MLDDRIAFLWRHRTGSKRVPGRLDVPLDPVLDLLDVLLGVFQVFVESLLVRIEEVRLRSLAGLKRQRP